MSSPKTPGANEAVIPPAEATAAPVTLYHPVNSVLALTTPMVAPRTELPKPARSSHLD